MKVRVIVCALFACLISACSTDDGPRMVVLSSKDKPRPADTFRSEGGKYYPKIYETGNVVGVTEPRAINTEFVAEDLLSVWAKRWGNPSYTPPRPRKLFQFPNLGINVLTWTARVIPSQLEVGIPVLDIEYWDGYNWNDIEYVPVMVEAPFKTIIQLDRRVKYLFLRYNVRSGALNHLDLINEEQRGSVPVNDSLIPHIALGQRGSTHAPGKRVFAALLPRDVYSRPQSGESTHLYQSFVSNGGPLTAIEFNYQSGSKCAQDALFDVHVRQNNSQGEIISRGKVLLSYSSEIRRLRVPLGARTLGVGEKYVVELSYVASKENKRLEGPACKPYLKFETRINNPYRDGHSFARYIDPRALPPGMLPDPPPVYEVYHLTFDLVLGLVYADGRVHDMTDLPATLKPAG